jgi:hypothetical protein
MHHRVHRVWLHIIIACIILWLFIDTCQSNMSNILPNQWLYSRTIRLYALDHINNVFLWDSAVF